MEPEHGKLLLLGRLGRTFQLEGGLHFYPLGPAEASAVSELHQVVVEGFGTTRLRRTRPHGNHLIVYLERVQDIDRARALVNSELLVDPVQLPPPPPGMAYLAALIGIPVERDGVPFGEVTDFLDAGGQSLLVVASGDRELLLPVAAPYVRLKRDRIEVEDAPPGLFEDT